MLRGREIRRLSVNRDQKPWSYHFLSSFNIKRCWPSTGTIQCGTGNAACGLQGVHLGAFLAEPREEASAAACELCATATSNHRPSVRLSRDRKSTRLNSSHQ